MEVTAASDSRMAQHCMSQVLSEKTGIFGFVRELRLAHVSVLTRKAIFFAFESGLFLVSLWSNLQRNCCRNGNSKFRTKRFRKATVLFFWHLRGKISHFTVKGNKNLQLNANYCIALRVLHTEVDSAKGSCVDSFEIQFVVVETQQTFTSFCEEILQKKMMPSL